MAKKCAEPMRRLVGGTWRNHICGAPVVAEYMDESPADPEALPVWHPVCVSHRRAKLGSGHILDIRDAY